MSSSPQKRIRYRVIIPFISLFAVTSIITWASYVYLITRYIDHNLENQMNQITEIISGSGYILNSNILNKLKNIINAEICLFDGQGRLIQSTTDAAVFKDVFSNDRVTDIISGDIKYRTITRSLMLPEFGKSYISLWMPADEINRIKINIIVIMGIISLFGVFSMGTIGFFIARSITSPIEKFVEIIKNIDSGKSDGRVDVNTRDEIGILSESFNNMIDRVKESEKKLVESEKMSAAGQMAAGFAHEIKNPLTGIKMMAQILHRRLKGQNENQEILTSFLKEINRLDHVINEIINRARPTELNRSWGNVNSSIREVIDLVSEGYSENGISINLNLSDNLSELFIDHDKIKQALWNLIFNGREAMPGGGTLGVSTDLRDNSEVEVIISDTGNGIEQDDLDLLFKPFYTSKPEGVGLGLSTSRKIIEKHDGILFLRNRSGQGAEAVFRIPLSKAESVND